MWKYEKVYKCDALSPFFLSLCVYIYGLRASHLALNNQLGGSSLGKANFPFL